MKPFRVVLAEQDQDFEYKLCSIENIGDTYVLDRIRLALGRYGLISVESMGATMKLQADENSMFPNYPFLPIYTVKVVMTNPITSRNAIQSVALFSTIPQETLKFFDMSGNLVMDGVEAEQNAHGVEVDKAFAQSEVGDSRAKALVSDMMKDIMAKRDGTVKVPVYETTMISHHEVQTIIGQRVSRGFYMMEAVSSNRSLITGPFGTVADNLDFPKSITPGTLVESRSVGDMMEFTVSSEPSIKEPVDAGRRVEHKPMQVVLIDQDTGKEYTVVVRSSDEESARSSAIEILAGKTGISKEKLLPKAPNAV